MTTLNERAFRLLESAATDEAEEKGILLIDVGVEKTPDNPLETGLSIASASMGGLAKVEAREGELKVSIPENPALATLGCQLAGWKVADGAYASGPARVLARKPKEFYNKVGYNEASSKAAVIIECNNIPTKEILEKIRDACGVRELACACFKPDSEVGIINVLSRVVEMAFFRLDYLGYDTRKILKAEGTVPFNGIKTQEEGNDAIIYGGSVSLETRGWDGSLTKKCVSRASRLYGRRFADVLAKAGGDFMEVDFDYYAPAELKVRDLASGGSYSTGGVKKDFIGGIRL